ncbi:hypothetical protein SUGI_0150330 [Cryptomeria japonica]|nr:hypothetical protein SUGI_0150330 [Cryptomeria japonica]
MGGNLVQSCSIGLHDRIHDQRSPPNTLRMQHECQIQTQLQMSRRRPCEVPSMAASSEKTAPSNNRQGGGNNEIFEVFSIPISTKKRKRGEESKNERHTSSKGKEKQEKPTPASAAKKVRFQEEVTTETKEIDERENSILKRRKESSLVENDKKKDEGKEKHSEVLDHIHTKNMIEGCVKSMISEAKQEFGKENKSIMDAFQNKARQGNEKRRGSASYNHRADMFDSLPCSHYIRTKREVAAGARN